MEEFHILGRRVHIWGVNSKCDKQKITQMPQCNILLLKYLKHPQNEKHFSQLHTCIQSKQ